MKLVQLPLIDVIRIKKTGISAGDIEKIKLRLHYEGARIISFVKKPTDDKEGGEKI